MKAQVFCTQQKIPQLFLIRSQGKCIRVTLGYDLRLSICSVRISTVFLSPYRQLLGSYFISTMTTSCSTLCKWSVIKLSWAAGGESLNVIEVSWFSRDGLRLRRSVGSHSLRRPGFDPRQFHVRLVMHITAARMGFFPWVSLHQSSILILIYILHLPEGQTGEA